MVLLQFLIFMGLCSFLYTHTTHSKKDEPHEIWGALCFLGRVGPARCARFHLEIIYQKNKKYTLLKPQGTVFFKISYGNDRCGPPICNPRKYEFCHINRWRGTTHTLLSPPMRYATWEERMMYTMENNFHRTVLNSLKKKDFLFDSLFLL